jgi:hypothetical protein
LVSCRVHCVFNQHWYLQHAIGLLLRLLPQRCHDGCKLQYDHWRRSAGTCLIMRFVLVLTDCILYINTLTSMRVLDSKLMCGSATAQSQKCVTKSPSAVAGGPSLNSARDTHCSPPKQVPYVYHRRLVLIDMPASLRTRPSAKRSTHLHK